MCGKKRRLTVRFFGELPEKELKWTLYENGACEDVIDGTVTLKHSDVTAFSDYALGQYSADAEILDVDKYNATVAFLNYLSEGSGKGVIFWDKWDFSLMRWYEYELSLEPGQTLTNTVTAPLYPDIDASYSPSVYSYKYLLSPAKKWADFGELKIVVKTPYFITKSGIDGFFKTDAGYELSLPVRDLAQKEGAQVLPIFPCRGYPIRSWNFRFPPPNLRNM